MSYVYSVCKEFDSRKCNQNTHQTRTNQTPNTNTSGNSSKSGNAGNNSRTRSSIGCCYTYEPHNNKLRNEGSGVTTSLGVADRPNSAKGHEPDTGKPENTSAEPSRSSEAAENVTPCPGHNVKPGPKNINILLLGETGVGKTTFINSLLNNLEHKTLKSMLGATPHLLVDAAFTLSDEHDQIIRVRFKANYTNSGQYGAGSTNEQLNDKGNSATQGPVVHDIIWEDTTGNEKLLKIIDTPGTSDIRGKKQDEENFEKILRCINKLGELHAICIVMKPNQARFSLSFRNNIESFLTRLNRDAIKNILFCFTNTRPTLYQPGNTLATLHSYLATLEKEKGILIKADKYNIFCFDNDCFRYVLAVKNGAYVRTDELDTLFSESWERNVGEYKKLLARAECLPIHNVQDTLNIDRTQQLVTILAKPLAEIARNHLVNMKHTEEYMKQIRDLQSQTTNLRSQIKKKITVLEPRKLQKPRTVCKSERCTRWKLSDNGWLPEYAVCHDRCDAGVSPHTGHCAAFQRGGNFQTSCTRCSCHKNYHEHQFYQNVTRQNEVVDRRTEDEYHDVAQTAANRKKLLEEEKEKYKNLEFEHDSIRDFCAEAAVFLLENVIKSGGDPYLHQIQNLISDEESKMKLGGDAEMYYELEVLLAQYRERVKSLQEDIRENRRTPVTCDELFHKMDILALQPHCGEQVKQLKAMCEENIYEQEEKAKMEESPPVNNDSKSNRLLARAECLPIHNVQDTLSINRTLQLVTILAKPLAEIARNHLVNMKHTEEYMKQARQLKKAKLPSVSDKRPQRTQTVLEPQRLHKPRTVCRSPKYKNLEFEHDSIRDFCAEAAVFLLESAIKSEGDPYLHQIQNLISDEESKVKLGGDAEMYYELLALLEQYKERVKSLQEDIRENRRTPVTCDDLFHKMDILALQPHCGEQVKQLKAMCEENVVNLEKKSKAEGSDSVNNDSKSNRPLESAERVPAQKAKDILSEKQTEQLVTITAKPLIELVRNHLVNMNMAGEYMKQVKGMQNCTSNLQYQVTKKIIILEFRKRAKPRTVCKSPKCTIWQKRPNEWTPDHRICHDEGDTDTSPVPFSTKNWSYCMACGCHKKNHEHQLYQSETRVEEMVDKRAQYELEDVAQRAGNVKKVLEEEQQKDKQLELEHDLIRDFCAEAAVFLLKNSAEDPYLLQIQNMETKMKLGEVADMYYGLLAFLEQYKEKVKKVQEDIQEGRRSPVVACELMHKMDSLTLQPHSGEQVKRLRAICQDHIKELEQKV